MAGICLQQQAKKSISKKPNDHLHEKVRQIMENQEAYVLVTCTTADKKGKMAVEFSFDGSPDLASYLLDGAQEYLEEELA